MYSQARLENLPPSSLLLPTFSHFPPRWTSTAGSLLLSAYSLNAANSMILFEGDFEILRSLISWWENIGVGWGEKGTERSHAWNQRSGPGSRRGPQSKPEAISCSRAAARPPHTSDPCPGVCRTHSNPCLCWVRLR